MIVRWILACLIASIDGARARGASTQPPAQPSTQPSGQSSSQAQAPTFKPEEIEALVAPIALYPDSVLAQSLMASTYPLEVV